MTDREVAPTGKATRRGRVRSFVADRSYPQRLGALGVVLVLLTAPFGGLRSAAEEDTKPLRLGQRVDIGPFYLTLETVTQLGDLEPAVSPDKAGDKLVALKVEVTNHSDRAEAVSLVRDAIGGSHTGYVPWADDPDHVLQVFDAEDATWFNDFVNPGQTYTLALVLQQDPDTDLDEMAFAIYGYYFREVDPGTLAPNQWVLDDQPMVEGHVAVRVRQ